MIDFALGVFFLFGALCFYLVWCRSRIAPRAYLSVWERARAKLLVSLLARSVWCGLNEERTCRVGESIWPRISGLRVIVVNDGSTDATADVAQRFLSDPRLRYFAKPNGGKASALNLGPRTHRRSCCSPTLTAC
jgi:hypothetical protein